MTAMTPGEISAFLEEGTRTAKVATVREDGRPHVAPVWFVLDGRDVVFSTGRDTVKGATLRRDNRVAIVVDLEQPPFGFVMIEGQAEFDQNPATLREWNTRIAARYMGQAQAAAYGERNSGPGSLLVRVRPVRVTAEKNVTA